MSAITQRLQGMVLLLAAIAFSVAQTSVQAAAINYGDFSGSTVMYLGVTEKANSPVNAEPLFNAPTIVGDELDFNPSGFSAQSSGARFVNNGWSAQLRHDGNRERYQQFFDR